MGAQRKIHVMRTKFFLVALLVLTFLCLGADDLLAQCPMCKMSAESNMKGGGTAGRGLNAGILYMLAAPYLIVGGIAYWWWRNRNETLEASEMEAE